MGAVGEGPRFTVLGPVRVWRDGVGASAGTPRQQAMLVALLLHPGRAVSAERLVEALWGDEPPGKPLSALRTYAWGLRRVVERDAAEPEVLLRSGSGYRLAVPEEAVDAERASALVAEAARARAGGRPESAGDLLATALGLWQDGEPLAGVPGPYADRQRERLAELRLAALEERLDLDVDLGRHRRAIARLSDLAAAHPLRERPYALLMRALHADGRRAEALEVFDGHRRRLAEELGIDPGPELLAVRRHIGAAEPGRPDPRPEPPFRATVADLPVPAQLPGDLPDFTGRAAPLTELCDRLTATGGSAPVVVAVSGMGGIGKTSLALRAAHRVRGRYGDGQLYADLGGVGAEPVDPAVVLAWFLAALGVADEAIPEGVEQRSRLFRSLLDGRRVLIVLDDVRDDAQVRPLLPGSAGCAVLLTSRSLPAGLPLTGRTALEAFHPGEALGLLGAVIGHERLAGERVEALDLAAVCGFHPLAVRIVATRLAVRPGWTLAGLVERLGDEQRRLRELRVGTLAVDAVFELSYRQLTAEQARAFRLLTLAGASSVSPDVAAALLGTTGARARDLLESLVDAALLEASAAGRYRRHELVRAFAAERAERHPEETGPALARLLDFLLASACEAVARLVPGDPVADVLNPGRATGLRFRDLRQARSWVEAESDTVLEAVLRAAGRPAGEDGGSVRTAANLLLAVIPFVQDAGDARCTRLAPAALAVAEAAERRGDPGTAAKGRLGYSGIVTRIAGPAAALEHARLAAEGARAAGDRVILRQALNGLGVIAQILHRHEEAIVWYDQAVELARELGHRSGEASSTAGAALARVRSGRAAEAVSACDRALALLRPLGDQAGIAHALYVQALALHDQGRHGEAIARFCDCLSVCRGAGIQGWKVHALYRLADSLRATGRSAEAVGYAQRAVERCLERGSEWDRGLALTVRGQAQADLGRTEAARADLEQAHAVFTRLGLPDAVEAERLLGLLAR
ncbi:BTAD domain-containing putative transcriptional regulator [Kitasatospora sp. NPDC056783]|uniref:AfsR/SARP family transcriptional regulator n=1 Tax=Kitasatospora sp. NPDC056783 TaxID=3345943 RepID=UPI00369C6628